MHTRASLGTPPPLDDPVRRIGARTFDFARHVAVMAIVNRTPDSFYDGGATFALDAAVTAGVAAARHGADWVDVGGVPFAPGPPLPVADEIERVVPVIAGIRAATDVVISVDTFEPAVAEASLAAGADVVNDTTGLHHPELAEVVAAHGAHLVLTHSLATPRTPYAHPSYTDVVAEVTAFLADRIERAVDLGVPRERLLIDPGHDLNKNTRHSLELTRRFAEIAALGLPALAAVSNKDFIGETLDAPKDRRLAGTLATIVACVLGGARVVRVHDVAETVAAVTMTEAILGLREPARLRHNMGEFNE